MELFQRSAVSPEFFRINFSVTRKDVEMELFLTGGKNITYLYDENVSKRTANI